MGLILKNLISKEDEDIASMPDPKQGMDDLLKKYQFLKELHDKSPNTGPDQTSLDAPGTAIEEGITDQQSKDQSQILDSETLGKGLIGKAMISGADSTSDGNQTFNSTSFNLSEALKNSGSLAEISKNMIRQGRFSDDWPEGQAGQPAFSVVPWREPDAKISGSSEAAIIGFPQAGNSKETGDGRTENERRFDNQIKAGTFDRLGEISRAFRGQESLPDQISNAWDAFKYERPDALEFREKLMQAPNIKAAILNNMLAGPIPAIAAGLAQMSGKSDSDIYDASQIGVALDGLATSRAAISHPMAYTGARQMPDPTEPKAINTNKPYAKSRPPYGKNQVEITWNDAVQKSKDTNVYDPNINVPLLWDRSKTRSGQWDMGHKPGFAYAELHARYMAEEITLEQFLKEYRDPANYRPESPNSNRGRKNQGY